MFLSCLKRKQATTQAEALPLLTFCISQRNRSGRVCVCVCRETDLRNEIMHILICTVEYYSATKRNEIGSFVDTWMDLESVTQNEVSQKEKNKHHVLMHIY